MTPRVMTAQAQGIHRQTRAKAMNETNGPRLPVGLNNRPRKTLGYRKPSEKILELINAA